jgi:pimeloyl-ACP methyl ester carboxylesterase
MRTRSIATNGVTLQVTEAGDPGAPVVLLHGFPELAHTWRHQVPALAAAGYHVLAPDQRGYGRSSAPPDVGAYTVADLSADAVGLLDDVGAEQAVVVGHDFGGVVSWGAPLLYPDRFTGVVGISVPPVPRPRVPTTQAFRRLFGDTFCYILYFQDVGPADAELDADPATTLRKIMAADLSAPPPELDPTGFLDRIAEPGHRPPWLSDDEFAYYVTEFTRTGFTGPLNWYRCFDRNWELTASPPAPTPRARHRHRRVLRGHDRRRALAAGGTPGRRHQGTARLPPRSVGLPACRRRRCRPDSSSSPLRGSLSPLSRRARPSLPPPDPMGACRVRSPSSARARSMAPPTWRRSTRRSCRPHPTARPRPNRRTPR